MEESAPPRSVLSFVSAHTIAKEREEAQAEGRVYRNDKVEVQDDGLTLYERLQKNKEKKDEEFQEKIKFRPPQAMTSEDANWYDEIAQKEKKRKLEEKAQDKDALEEFKKAKQSTGAAVIPAAEPPKFKTSQVVQPKSTKLAKKPLLATVVVQKKGDDKSKGISPKKVDAPAAGGLLGLASYGSESDSD